MATTTPENASNEYKNQITSVNYENLNKYPNLALYYKADTYAMGSYMSGEGTPVTRPLRHCYNPRYGDLTLYANPTLTPPGEWSVYQREQGQVFGATANSITGETTENSLQLTNLGLGSILMVTAIAQNGTSISTTANFLIGDKATLNPAISASNSSQAYYVKDTGASIYAGWSNAGETVTANVPTLIATTYDYGTGACRRWILNGGTYHEQAQAADLVVGDMSGPIGVLPAEYRLYRQGTYMSCVFSFLDSVDSTLPSDADIETGLAWIEANPNGGLPLIFQSI